MVGGSVTRQPERTHHVSLLYCIPWAIVLTAFLIPPRLILVVCSRVSAQDDHRENGTGFEYTQEPSSPTPG